MADTWFCRVDGQQYGPYTWEQMRAMAAEGRLIADSLVRREADKQWFRAARVPALLPPSAIPVAAAAVAAKPDSPPKLNTAPAPSPPQPKLKKAKRLEPQSPPPVAPPPADPQPGTAIKKQGRPLLVAGMLGGTCALVAAVAIGLIVWSYSRSKKNGSAQPVADAAQAVSPEIAVLAPAAEANPVEVESNPVSAPAAKAPAQAAATASQAAAAKIVASLSKWTDVSKLRRLGIDNLNMKIASVWLAADEAGTRVEPAVGTEATAAAKGKFVFVEVQISNESAVAKKYKSWNAGVEAAILADNANQPLPLIPVSATPGVTRLEIVEILPNQTVTDVLVFAAPQTPIETLRLALAKTALAEHVKLPSHFALEIPLEVLLRIPQGKMDKQALAGAIVGADAPPQSAAATSPASASTVAAAAPAAAPAAAKPKGPPSIAELNAQFEELAKKREAEKQKSDPPQPSQPPEPK